jgi:hypothetical protein
MVSLRTLGPRTEVLNILALGTFAAFGLLIVGVGVAKSSVVLVVLGLLYSLGTIWYLTHLLLRVSSELLLDTETNELHWVAVARRGHFPMASMTSVRPTHQPDVYAFTFADGSSIRFWHRHRGPEAQEFFKELRKRSPATSFNALYRSSAASWRRGLPGVINDSSTNETSTDGFPLGRR